MSYKLNPQKAYERLCVLQKDIAMLNSIIRLLEWDQRIKLPQSGSQYRTDQLEALSIIIHKKQTSPEINELLEIIESSTLVSDQMSDIVANVCEIRREYDRNVRLPEGLVAEWSRAKAEASNMRLEALKKNEFQVFSPSLINLLDIAKRMANEWGYTNEPYDAFLDGYEPDLTAEETSHLLSSLSGEMVKLLNTILATGKQPRIALDKGPYLKETQIQLCSKLVELLGLGRDFVRLNSSESAFCEAIAPGDIRLAAVFSEKDFREGFFGSFHEAGHALYHVGLDSKYFGLPIGTCSSYAIRESQARLWENCIGHSAAFWEFWYPQFKKAFPETLKGIDLQEFFLWINQVSPSFIRVDADEVTYNLHIIIRFEIERALFQGNLEVKDIPNIWNTLYKERLGITPFNLKEGCLQDVHWSWGAFGYFPTYGLGNIYAAQFYDSAKSEIKDLESQLRKGEYTLLCDWLKKNIHQHGKRFSPGELVKRVTGKSLSHKFLVSQLWNRYGKIYDIEQKND